MGLYIRSRVAETPEFLSIKPTRTPVHDLLVNQWDRVLLAIGAVVVSTSSNYLILYMPTYAAKSLHLPQSTGFVATLVGAVILTFGAPMIGHWSDTVGRSRIMMTTTVLFLVSVYPVFSILTAHASMATLILTVAWMSLLKTGYSGALPAFLAECFPAQTRATGHVAQLQHRRTDIWRIRSVLYHFVHRPDGQQDGAWLLHDLYRIARPCCFAHGTRATASPVTGRSGLKTSSDIGRARVV